MKLIDLGKEYGILDQLFRAIQENGHAAYQQMIDDAWKKWCYILTVYDVDKVIDETRCNCYCMESQKVIIIDDIKAGKKSWEGRQKIRDFIQSKKS